MDTLNKQRLRQTLGKGTRQNTSVTSEEARPLTGYYLKTEKVVSLKRGWQLFIKKCDLQANCYNGAQNPYGNLSPYAYLNMPSWQRLGVKL